MIKIMIAVLVLSSLTACATLESTMSGKIGCPEDEVNIYRRNPGYGFTTSSYYASCRGRRFVCSLAPTYDNSRPTDLNDMNCSREL